MYPALAGNEKLEYPDYAVFIVLNGYKAMPSFAHTLSDEQVAAVVNYLQSGLGVKIPMNRPLHGRTGRS
jgi:mono/diheme cytochrome c family protein